MGNKILVMAPHPDDETLGCGGTLLKHAASGDEIHWLIMTEMKAEDGWAQEKMNSRQDQIDKVAGEYGFAGVHQLNLPAAGLDEQPFARILQEVKGILEKIQPATVYAPNPTDAHSDHLVSFNALWGAAKTFRSPYVRRILSYETLSETEFGRSYEKPFEPNVLIDVSDHFDKKLEIMQIYAEEVMPGHLPRSLETLKALAVVRGSRCNANYAEAFHLWQEIS